MRGKIIIMRLKSEIIRSIMRKQSLLWDGIKRNDYKNKIIMRLKI